MPACTSGRTISCWRSSTPPPANLCHDGETGELVLTSINREAMPLLRYRTRDLTSVIPEPCACGRTHRRIHRITGRSDDMLIVRGVNIFPQQIERVLMSIPQIGRNYLIQLEGLDDMTVKVELSPAGFDGEVGHLAATAKPGRGKAPGRTLGPAQGGPGGRRFAARRRRQGQARH